MVVPGGGGGGLGAHDVVDGGAHGAGPGLRSVREREARRVYDAVVAYERHWHLKRRRFAITFCYLEKGYVLRLRKELYW